MNEKAPETTRAHLLAEIVDGDARGTVTVAPSVLVEVIELTARGVEGVSGFATGRKASGRSHSIVDGPLARSDGGWHEEHGIRVNLADGVLDADLTISVEAGVTIPGVAAEIQDRLRATVKQLLGFSIGSLAIHVADVVPLDERSEDA